MPGRPGLPPEGVGQSEGRDTGQPVRPGGSDQVAAAVPVPHRQPAVQGRRDPVCEHLPEQTGCSKVEDLGPASHPHSAVRNFALAAQPLALHAGHLWHSDILNPAENEQTPIAAAVWCLHPDRLAEPGFDVVPEPDIWRVQVHGLPMHHPDHGPGLHRGGEQDPHPLVRVEAGEERHRHRLLGAAGVDFLAGPPLMCIIL